MKYLITSAAVMLLCFGCSLVPSIRRVAIPPAAEVFAGASAVKQKGEAQVPASAKVEAKRQSITLPAGTVVWQDAKSGEIRYKLGTDTPITAETKLEQATAPAAFTPPAPPTVGEEAQARTDSWTVLGYRIGIFVGIAGAIFGATRAWSLVMWGGIAVSGGSLAGLFIKSHPALLLIIGGGAILYFVGPILWHAKLKHLEKDVTSTTK